MDCTGTRCLVANVVLSTRTPSNRTDVAQLTRLKSPRERDNDEPAPGNPAHTALSPRTQAGQLRGGEPSVDVIEPLVEPL